MIETHVGCLLDALLAVPLPHGYTSAYHQRYDTVIDHTCRQVVISPDGMDSSRFTFGTPGAYAHIHVNSTGGYVVGVFTRDVGYHVQAAGKVVTFTTAAQAVSCAVNQLRSALLRQRRGW